MSGGPVLLVNGHVVRYVDGHLVAEAHGEPEAEAALSALGAGNPCRCLRYVAAWEAAIADPRTPLVAPRSASDAVHLDLSELDVLEDHVRAWQARMQSGRREVTGAPHLDETLARFDRRLTERLLWLLVWTMPMELLLLLREHTVGRDG